MRERISFLDILVGTKGLLGLLGKDVSRTEDWRLKLF